MPDGPPLLLPDDVWNRALLAATHPVDHRNPAPAGRYHLVVVGAGTAGLVAAAGAAGLGARVALVERHLMGGDCLNYGCVPSKALLGAAHAAHAQQAQARLGTGQAGAAEADFAAAMTRLRRLRAAIAPHDAVERFTGLGVDVFLGAARFVAPDAVEVAGARLPFTRAVVATGARASVPPVPGLAEAGFRTNDTLWELTARPPRVAVLGAGPIGCEIGQALRRLGSAVTIVSLDPRVLPRDDEHAASVVGAALEADGVALALGATVTGVRRTSSGREVGFDRGRGDERVEVDEIVVATGRTPNVEGLGLEAAGVAASDEGVVVDDFLRTTNRRVYAAGDVCSAFRFTHAADAAARLVIQNALFFGRKRASRLVIPWCTYTDPELAHVGMSGAEAQAREGAVVSIRVDFADVDRAVLDGRTDGFVELRIEARTGRIAGATVVGSGAGDLIGDVSLAMTAGVTADQLSAAIRPYPTRGEALKKVGDAWRRRKLTPTARRLLTGVLRLRK
ncbi:MAG: FAD-containing oxidoreductase [Vicinamibacterales bacterium]